MLYMLRGMQRFRGRGAESLVPGRQGTVVFGSCLFSVYQLDPMSLEQKKDYPFASVLTCKKHTVYPIVSKYHQ